MTRIKIICSHYESGYGHGVKDDGFDLSKTPYSDPELGEAYQYGYQCGNNAKVAPILSDAQEPDTTKDSRFVCAKCGSDDVKIAPMYGSSSRCCNCGHKWENP